MIPKKIHYCWLSDEKKPPKIERCMASWAKLEGYQVVHWDMAKAHALKSSWVEQAIAAKNWAFAADYIRLFALWTDGGVYLDTDVEIVKDFGALLEGPLMLGEEGGTGMIEAAVMGAEAGREEMRRVLDSFEAELTRETLPCRMGRVLKGVKLLKSAVLSPKDWRTGKLQVTDETIAIHHFAGSWLSKKERAAQWAGRRFGKWAVPIVRWIGHRFECRSQNVE